MSLEIVQAGHPVLRQVAHEVAPEAIGGGELSELIDEMVETMREAPGVGLAAPQVGLPLRLCVVEHREEYVAAVPEELRLEQEKQPVPLTVLINPTIEPVGHETAVHLEGCLSVAGWFGETPRCRKVRVRALDHRGEQVKLEWSGWPARILQHEVDHLKGDLFIDRIDMRTFTHISNVPLPVQIPKRQSALFDQDQPEIEGD